MSVSSSPPAARFNAPAIIAACCVLALLHAGRAVLQPLALAAMLALAGAPLLRVLGRLGLGRGPALLAGVAVGGAVAAAALIALASQLLQVGTELPQYRAAIAQKAAQLHALAERPFAHVRAGLDAVAPFTLSNGGAPVQAVSAAPLPNPDLAHMLGLAWGPLGETGLVLVLLLFILLEHETLQDRLIRLAGHSEVSRTIRALADAAQGVSRFFFCQFLINATFGAAIGIALWLIGLPHALLWGVLSFALRFLPYLGALAAGAAIACFAAATQAGWALPLACVALFGALEILVANLVEPRVVGHSTGLSPLAVVISAAFWGSVWGPVGLLLSTPLTVCLVVAGRHLPALEALAVLLGAAPDVTAAQRFFQRTLTGETAAIVRDAARFLRRATLARYCDQVLLPGLALAATELELGRIDAGQQETLRRAIADVAEAVAPGPGQGSARKRRAASLLDANVGAHLRRLREARLGRWQGSFDVPRRSIVLCAGLPTERDELVSELLARALREAGIDARNIPLPLPYEEHDPATAELVCTVLLPCPQPDTLDTWQEAVSAVRQLLPDALLAAIRLPGDDSRPGRAAFAPLVDAVLRSFEEGLAFAGPAADGRHAGRAGGGAR